MSAPPSSTGIPIESKDDLIHALKKGKSPSRNGELGRAREIRVHAHDLKPLPFAGDRSISSLLEGLAARDGPGLRKTARFLPLPKTEQILRWSQVVSSS